MTDAPIPILYTAGSGRSGTTLLTRILGQIDRIASVGEIRHLWQLDPLRERCGCGRLFAECPFWGDVFDEAFGGMNQIDFADMYALRQSVDRIRYVPAMYLLPADSDYQQRLNDYRTQLLALYRAILKVSGAQIVFDPSKDVSMLYLLAQMPEVRLYVLHQVRDSRAVAHSWMRKKKRRRSVEGESYMRQLTPFQSSRAWVYRNLMTELIQNKVAGYMRLRYEDLVAEPQTQTEKVLNLIGIEEADLSFIQSHQIHFAFDNHTVSGNPMRFEKGAIDLSLDEAWRQKMAEGHKKVVTAVSWPFLRRYNYL